MNQVKVNLSNEEYEKLEAQFPRGEGSALIGNRAKEIVKLHFRCEDPTCRFVPPELGADLKVVFSTDRPSTTLEIKGTEQSDIAWQQLKVSSEHSYRLLTEKKIPLYRVIDVFGRNPSIYILIHGVDFELAPEPRWSIKRISNRKKNMRILGDGSMTAHHAQRSLGQRSKYENLRDYLKAQVNDEVTLHFSDAPKLLGFSLPASASAYQAFWANQTNTKNRPWAKAWRDAGFRVESYKLAKNGGWVRFKRDRN